MKKLQIFFMVVQVPLDFFMLLLSGLSAYHLRFADFALEWKPVLFGFSQGEYLAQIIPIAGVWILLFALAGLYTSDPNRKFAADIVRIFLSCLSGLALIAIYLMFTQQLFDSRFLAAASTAFAFFYIIFGRLLIRAIRSIIYRSGHGLRHVIIIGSNTLADELQKTFENRKELGYTVLAKLSQFEAPEQIIWKDKNIDEIILADTQISTEKVLDLISFCNEEQITFKYSADLFATYATHMHVQPLAGIPLVEIKKTRLEGWWSIVKRLSDIVFGLFFAIVLSPIMLIAALIILIETGRPIFFKNERIGKDGKIFFAYKFRSMYQKDCTGVQFGKDGKVAEEKEKELIKKQSTRVGPIYKIENDPRITPFGRFIRRWSIDEMPQFFNVLLGNMSIVGPRPHQIREVAGYQRDHKKVFSVYPGITGLSQISGRSDLSYEEEMKLDIFYIENWSVYLDLIIIFKTPFILFKSRKAL